MSKKKKPKQPVRVTKGPTPFEVRVRIVREVLKGSSKPDVALVFGVSLAAVQKYVKLYRDGGVDALHPKLTRKAPEAVPSPKKKAREEAVVAARTEHPEWGTRRIRDVLARFEGLGVSETEVRRILHEAGLIRAQAPARGPREERPRRFERAEPNQLWQSDIFTFLLRRYQRVYLAAFLDDHSRYLVSHALAHHQKAELVLEAFERGVADYGTPRELLTDQGRQYTAWRGETAFEQVLRQHGIRHVKSRPQHPQTLGKIERFWKTLWDEFLSRTVFADFADLDRRLGLFVKHYNFQRPHQALSGLVPADRFFRAAPQVLGLASNEGYGAFSAHAR
jgi:transposase InsO family protein